MNKKSNYFNSLFLFALTVGLGFLLHFLGPQASSSSRVETQVEAILLEESKFLTEELDKNFVSYLITTAKEYEIDPILVLAVMKVESSFKPDAKSHAGALGLLQLKPIAAKEVAKQFAVKPVNRQELMNPFINVKVGIQYLSYLRDYLGKDHLRFLSAYNLGPTKVKRSKTHSTKYARKVLRIYSQFLQKYTPA